MPKLDDKNFKYDKKGMKAYIKALKKKRKKRNRPAYPNPGTTNPLSGPGGGH